MWRSVIVVVIGMGLIATFVLSPPEARIAEAFAFVLVWANNVERKLMRRE